MKTPSTHTIWSSRDAARITGGQAVGRFTASGVAMNVAALRKGDLFAVSDTGQITQAVAAGAAALMIAPAHVHLLPAGMPALLVADVKAALEALATAARLRCGMQLIAVRRGVDADTVQLLAATLLQQQGMTHTRQTGDNVADIASIHAGTDYALFTDAICTDVRPDMFIDMDAGVVEAAEGSFRFGMGDEFEARVTQCLVASNGVQVEASVLGVVLKYRLPMASQRAAVLSVAVLLMMALAGADMKRAAADMARLSVPGYGRQEKIASGEAGNPITLIDESHYASPASAQAAFKVLALIDPGRGGRRIAILGDMVKVAGDNNNSAAALAKAHADLALPLRAANVDLVYTCGAMMKHLHDTLPANQRGAHADTPAQLGEIVPDALMPGDVVLVKGARESKMRVVVEALRGIPVRKAKEQLHNTRFGDQDLTAHDAV